MKSSGNYLDGEKWDKFGCELKWSSETAADLINADYQGRCVNTVNVLFRGSTGIGSLPLLSAGTLLQQLYDLGFQRVCRLDLSIDVFNAEELDTRLITSQLESGVWKIPRRSPSSYTYLGPLASDDSGSRGATLYIGAKSADVQACIYDKGIQQDLQSPWLRLEVRYRNEPALEAFQRLMQFMDGAMESGNPEGHMDDGVVGLVRGTIDIRDVSRWMGLDHLPKNWATDALTTYPERMHPVFGQTAPLQVGSFKASGAFAARTRHLMKSSGKHIWRLVVISVAKGTDPGAVALTMGAPSAGQITDEDFMDMAQVSGFTVAELEAAECKAHSLLMELHGINVKCIGSDRTLLREELLRTTGGV